MFFLLTLPFRLIFGLLCGLLFLPFVLLIVPFIVLRVLIKTVVLLVALPFVLLAVGGALLIGCVAVLFALMIPLLPVAFLTFCVWAIVRLSSRPALSR